MKRKDSTLPDDREFERRLKISRSKTGKVWVFDPSTMRSKVIDPNRIDLFILEGWMLGRTFRSRWMTAPDGSQRRVLEHHMADYQLNGWRPGRIRNSIR